LTLLIVGDCDANGLAAPNAEYATETREELMYNKEKLLSNGECAVFRRAGSCANHFTQETNGSRRLWHLQELMLLTDELHAMSPSLIRGAFTLYIANINPSFLRYSLGHKY